MTKGKYSREDNFNIPARMKVLAEAFTLKVPFDFGSMLFLGLKENQTMNLMVAEVEIAQLPGYARHRLVYYYEKVSHIYVEFDSPAHAIVAREHYIKKEEYHAEFVDQILKNWYALEMVTNSRFKVVYKIYARLFIDGTSKVDKFLSEDSVTHAIKVFGNPKMLDFRKRSVLIAFSSMTEGIAACIAHGRWKSMYLGEPDHFYRIQLERSNYLTKLLRPANSSTTLDDTYCLEYFMPDQETQKRLYLKYDCDESHSQNTTQKPYREFSRTRGGRKNYRGGWNSRSFRSTNFHLKLKEIDDLSGEAVRNSNPYA